MIKKKKKKKQRFKQSDERRRGVHIRGGEGGYYNSPSDLSEGHCDTEHLTSTNVQGLQVDL